MSHFFAGLACAAVIFMPPLGYSLRLSAWLVFLLWALMGAGVALWVRFKGVERAVEVGLLLRRARRLHILITAVAVHLLGADEVAKAIGFPLGQLLLLAFATLLYGLVVLSGARREGELSRRQPQMGKQLLTAIRGFLTPTIPFLCVWVLLAMLDTVPTLGETVWTYRSLLYPALALVMFGFAVAMPYLALVAIPSVRLRGELERRLIEIADRVGVPLKAIYVVRTGANSLPNAFIVGLFGRMRFVFVSEGLLMCPQDELEGIFAHELGHARLHHPTLFFIYGLGFLGTVVWLVAKLWEFGPSFEEATGVSAGLWGALAALALVTAFLLGFGWISRRFEQTADAYAANLVGPQTYAASLMRIWLAAGGMRKLFSHWRHFPLPYRIETVASLKSDPQTLTRIVRANSLAVLLLLAVTLLGLMLYFSLAIEDARLPEWEVAARRVEFASLSGKGEEARHRLLEALQRWPTSPRLLRLLEQLEESGDAPNGDR